MAKKQELTKIEQLENDLISAAVALSRSLVDAFEMDALAGNETETIKSDICDVLDVAHCAKQRKIGMAR